MACRWSWMRPWSWTRDISKVTSLNQRHLAMDRPDLFRMRLIDGKLFVALIGADTPEHCAYVGPLLCSLHLQTELKCCSEIAQDRADTWRWRDVMLNLWAGKTTELPGLLSSFEPCWNLWCLFSLVRRFFCSWMFHSVKGVWRGELFAVLYMHTVMVQEERIRRESV